MFIAARAAQGVKLRRSGMSWPSLGHCRRSVGVKIPVHAAPTELGRASGVIVTINMALLTELDQALSPKKRVRCRGEGTHGFRFAMPFQSGVSPVRRRPRRSKASFQDKHT